MIRALSALCLTGLLPAFLVACGPVPLADAERECISSAQMTQHPRGSVGIGYGSGGRGAAYLDLGISSNYILGRDPDQVYASCVHRRSGQMPSRPFTSLPESRL
jgi:hypothetical protein